MFFYDFRLNILIREKFPCLLNKPLIQVPHGSRSLEAGPSTWLEGIHVSRSGTKYLKIQIYWLVRLRRDRISQLKITSSEIDFFYLKTLVSLTVLSQTDRQKDTKTLLAQTQFFCTDTQFFNGTFAPSFFYTDTTVFLTARLRNYFRSIRENPNNDN